jgi:hypothetical protein
MPPRPPLYRLISAFVQEFRIEVTNETRDLYRFFDATPFAEFLYEKVDETIRVDFLQELDYLTRYDAAFDAVQRIADMRDKDISLLVRLCLQNGGRLAKNRRDRFPLLRDDEVRRMEEAIQNIMTAPPAP